MTCKDCFHRESCDTVGDFCFPLGYCQHFINKNEILHIPCKVGDTVYEIFDGKIYEHKVFAISILMNQNEKSLDIIANNFRDAILHFEMIDIGKTLFLTREEADNALKERREK